MISFQRFDRRDKILRYHNKLTKNYHSVQRFFPFFFVLLFFSGYLLEVLSNLEKTSSCNISSFRVCEIIRQQN